MEEDRCAICLEVLEGSKNKCNLDCSHSFHTECLLKSFQRDVRCPICRTDMVERAPEVSEGRERRAVIEINLNEYNDEYMQSRRELRNYQSRVNRYVGNNPELKNLKESIKKMKEESIVSCKILERDWKRIEREAWGSDEMVRQRTACARKKRQLRNAVSRYNSIVEEQFGEPPLYTPPFSLQSLIRRHGEELFNSLNFL
jgi:hypothetical protein